MTALQAFLEEIEAGIADKPDKPKLEQYHALIASFFNQLESHDAPVLVDLHNELVVIVKRPISIKARLEAVGAAIAAALPTIVRQFGS
jgi:hypothetical protein